MIGTLCVIVSAFIVGPIILEIFDLAGVLGVSNDPWIEAIGLLAATAICLRVIDKRPWSDVWLDREASRPSLIAIGFILGGACIGVPILAMTAIGWLHIAPGPAGSWIGAMSRISLILIPAALLEELLTRGYILSALQRAWGWGWAVVATSIAFGLLHIWNDGANVESVLIVTLAGLFLAAVLYVTRSLYAAWAAHFAWNWVMAAIFHASVSGYPFEAPMYRYVDAGPDWATGGGWGPEGGIPAALGMVVGVGLLFKLKHSRSRSLKNSHVSPASQD